MKRAFLIISLFVSVISFSQARKITVSGGGASLVSIGVFTPEAWGAVGNGTTDDSAPFANMMADIPEGSTVWLTGSKSYKLPNKFTITKSIVVKSGGFKTAALTTSADNVLIEIAADNVTIDGIDFNVTGTRTAGAAIHGLHNSPTPAYNTTIKNCQFTGAFVGIKHDASFHLVVSECTFFEQWSRDMIVTNTLHPDIGDQHIFNNYFDGGFAHAPIISIEWNGGGGMTLTGNKWNWSGGVGVRYEALISANLSATNVFIVDGNSMENFTNRAIEGTTSGEFGKFSITDNEIAAYVTPIVPIELTNFKVGTITGNNISAAGTNTVAIKLNGCEDVLLANAYASTFTTPVELNSCTNITDLNNP